ncbi:MAG: protein kinase [Verrucomicrobiales bacterium]|nr:protein kinase [Verrucomicrobiales bacterium]
MSGNSPGPSNREEALFAMLLETPPGQRQAFLDQAGEGDAALRGRLMALLAAHEDSGTLLGGRPDAATTPEASTEVGIVLEEARFPVAEGVGAVLGRYKLLERLGEGGCGVVYVAEQTEPVRRRVALKVIKLGMDTRAVVARFEAERQALAMMDHPNIARVLDAGTTDQGKPFFVMELVRGVPITAYCDQARLSTLERLELFIKVCHAIQHAHQKGIIHRDIKPSNILVTLHDGIPVPKVIDFGIAKATEGRLTDATVYTQLHQFIGTPAYMSPEQAEMSGLDIDTRSDIYSLGVLLYEMLAGRPPFDPHALALSGLDGMRRTIREQEPERPSTRVATLSGEERTTTAFRRSTESHRLQHQLRGDLDWIVMKCLEKDRTRRYETAAGLAADITRHLTSEPVVARPPSRAYRLQKSFRRNRLLFLSTGAVGLALVSGLCLTLWQYVGKSRAEQEQAALRRQAEAKTQEALVATQAAAEQRDLARARLVESLIREGRSIRKSRQVGYRREVFDRLRQVAGLGFPQADVPALRSDAVACFGDWVAGDPVDLPFSGTISASALTGDGSLAALACEMEPVVVWDTRTGKTLASLKVEGTGRSLVFDPLGRTLHVVTSGPLPQEADRAPELHWETWSVRGDGSWVRERMRSLAGPAHFTATDRGLTGLVLDAEKRALRVLDLERGDVVARIPIEGRTPAVPVAEVSPDRSLVAYFTLDQESDRDARLEIWDVASGKRIHSVAPGEGGGRGLSFGPDGRTLAATFENGVMILTGQPWEPRQTFRGTFESSSGAILGGDPELLAVPGAQEFRVRVVEVQSGRESVQLVLPASPREINFSRDGSVLLVAHDLGCRVVRLGGDSLKVRLVGHVGGVPAVEFGPDGSVLSSVGKDRTIRSWNLAAPERARWVGQLPEPGQTLAFSRGGDRIFCGHYNSGLLSVWDSRSGQELRRIPQSPEHRGTTWSSAVSPDGKWFAAAGTGLRVWDVDALLADGRGPDGGAVPRISEKVGNSCVVFSPRGDRVASLDVESWQPVYKPRVVVRSLDPGATPQVLVTNCHNNFIQIFGFLPKSGHFAYVTQDRSVRILNPDTGAVVREFPTIPPGQRNTSFVSNLRCNPEETRLALVTPNGLGIEILDAMSGKVLYALPEEPGAVWWLAWSPEGRRLAVSRANGDISVWDVAGLEAQLGLLGLGL